MTGVFHRLIKEPGSSGEFILATILAKKGSAPQVAGASALFKGKKLLTGTLGGGILEGDATSKAGNITPGSSSLLYEFNLDANFTSVEGAICGGSAILLMDVDPGSSESAFSEMGKSISREQPGVLVTFIKGKQEVKINRSWFEAGMLSGDHLKEMSASLEHGNCQLLTKSESQKIFLEPVYPLPKLYIAGAGHIGKALAHMANLLDFEVTVIDDRAEYANPQNIPDAHHILVRPIGEAIAEIPKTANTYIIIVTRGHNDDAAALRSCIQADIPYIGMIGSKRKTRLMRDNFLKEGWASQEQIDRVHAPVGLKIGSRTIQEIALSISAQLVQVRNKKKPSGKSHPITGIVLAAGESSRMGKPKMMLPYGDSSIIETVLNNVNLSRARRSIVVLGANNEAITQIIKDLPSEIVLNPEYKQGMLSSVQCGIKSLPEDTEAVMVLLGDQPMIETSVMNQLMEKYKESDRDILVSSYKGKRGHPILFGARYFKKILGFTNDQSLKDLLKLHPEDIEEINTQSPEILRDIDTEQDYQNELKQYKL